jgi:Protein of unknown function (DUF3352)
MDPSKPGSPGSDHGRSISMPRPPTEIVRPSAGEGLIPPPGSSWGAWSEGHPPASRTGRAQRWLVVALATLLVVAGGGSAAAFFLMRGAGEELLQLVPASSEVVVTAYLDPSAGQKVNLMALANRFPALRDDQRFRQQIDDVLDEALEGAGLSHEDVRPWLGSQVAFVVDLEVNDDVPTASFLVASEDDEAARKTLEKALLGSLGNEQTSQYRGATMHIFGSGGTSSFGYVIVDHVVVLSNQSIGLTRVVDVSEGSAPAIADDPAFLDTISSLPQGKLGLAYVNPTEIANQAFSATGLGAAGTAPGLDLLRAISGVGTTLSAHPDGLAFDVAVRMDPSKLDPVTRLQLDQPVHENGVLGFVPADAYAVATQQGLDETLKQTVDQILATPEGERIRQRIGVDDALAALTGDLAFEVGPGSGPVPAGGAILIGVRDPSAVQRTLDGLAELVLIARGRAGAPAFGDVTGLERHDVLETVPKATWRSSTYQGTTIWYLDDAELSGTGFVPSYAVVEGAAIVGSSPTEIRKVIDTQAGSAANIGESSSYRRAVSRVPDGASTFYVDVGAIVSRFGSQLPPDVVSNIEPFKTVVQGASSSSSLITYRLFIEIH